MSDLRDLLRDGKLAERRLDDGRWVTLYPLLWGAGRLAVGGETSRAVGAYDEAYDYVALELARVAYLNWDGTGEPDGWCRHRPSNRRRPGGDPAREEVRP